MWLGYESCVWKGNSLHQGVWTISFQRKWFWFLWGFQKIAQDLIWSPLTSKERFTVPSLGWRSSVNWAWAAVWGLYITTISLASDSLNVFWLGLWLWHSGYTCISKSNCRDINDEFFLYLVQKFDLKMKSWWWILLCRQQRMGLRGCFGALADSTFLIFIAGPWAASDDIWAKALTRQGMLNWTSSCCIL